MFVLLLVMVGVLVFVVAAVAAGAGSSMAPAHPDRSGPYLPAERLVHQADLDRVRFSVGLRGYRMDEVDDVLDRLSVELADREARIGELERALSASRDSPVVAPDLGPSAAVDAVTGPTQSPTTESPTTDIQGEVALADRAFVEPARSEAGPAGAGDAADRTEAPDAPSAPVERPDR